MMRGGLRLRFAAAAALLVFTTITASVWTLVALSRLGGVVTETVRDSEAVSAVTTRLAGALEREDDALLLILAGDARGAHVLAAERAVVDESVAALFDLLPQEYDRELADPLRTELQAYRTAADAVMTLPFERDALVQYHLTANPLLRRVVNLTTVIRDRHFEVAQHAVARARDEARAARRAVMVVTVLALAIAVAVVWHLTATIVAPLRRITRGANAIRQGRFQERIEVTSRDELGELAATFNQMAEDLSEFRRTNIGEVVRAKNLLEATLEALPDAVVLLDADGGIQTMNRAATVALEAAGVREPTRLHDLRLQGLDHASVTRVLADSAAVGLPADLTRTIRVEWDGTVRRLLPRVVPLPGSPPESATAPPTEEPIAGAILILSDVTDLARLDEMRSELVAVASHELQTPLTTLRMTLLMLQEASDALPQRHRDLLATAHIGVEQLGETIREFLDLTRIEAGELRLNIEPIDLSLLVAESVQRVRGETAALGLSVDVRVDPGLSPIPGDRARLRAVLGNILWNALKYTPERGRVTIEAEGPRAAAEGDTDTVTLRITDTGPGVPPAFHARIFDKFFRLEHHRPTGRPSGHGAGIGLYMCRQIVELHGGRISCSAGSEGRGTCIAIALPLRHRQRPS
jgi:NtrC-family two-component system sensor histidine kinase KinB